MKPEEVWDSTCWKAASVIHLLVQTLTTSCIQCTLVSFWLFVETGRCILSRTDRQINSSAPRGCECQFLGCHFAVVHSFACY